MLHRSVCNRLAADYFGSAHLRDFVLQRGIALVRVAKLPLDLSQAL
jgi:hypothetical protein